MGVYYERVSWISGTALLIAFLLTFWPNRTRILIAAALWSFGMLITAGLSAYDAFLRGGIAYAFNASSGFPLGGLLIPMASLALAAAQSLLLFPVVSQNRALFLGKILLLVIWPALILLQWLPQQSRHSFHFFPFGTLWLGYPLLWFRIRENYAPKNQNPSQQ